MNVGIQVGQHLFNKAQPLQGTDLYNEHLIEFDNSRTLTGLYQIK